MTSIESFLATGRQLLPSDHRCEQWTPLWAYEGLTTYFEPSNQIFNRVLNFQWRDDDICVSSGPKAGTTWTQEMVWLIANGFDYEGAKKERLDVRFPYLEFGSGMKDDGLAESAVDRLNKMPVDKPRFMKTHLPLQLLRNRFPSAAASSGSSETAAVADAAASSSASGSSTSKMIYVTRNPKDVVVSYFHFLGKSLNLVNGSFEDFARDFMENKMEYCPYVDTVIDYWEMSKKDPNLLFITYEGLKKDFVGVAKHVANFLGKTNITDEQFEELRKHCSFDSMKNNDMVNFKAAGFTNLEFMRKGVVGDHKNHFHGQLGEDFDKFVQDKLTNTDLRFEFK